MQDTLLIVDNDESILRCLNLMFKNDFEIIMATNGNEALEILNQKKVDCIISDFDMDNGDGLFLLKNLEKKEIPFILITGHGEKNLYKTFANERTYHIFEKPLDMSIKLVVQNALSHFHSSQKQLKESLIGKNTAHILHDLNNGLTIIQGSASAGLVNANPESSKYFSMSVRACQKITTIVSKYRALLNDSDGAQLTKLNMNVFIENLTSECRDAFTKNIRFEFESPKSEAIDVLADPHLLRQVLLNLISNSVYESQGCTEFTIRFLLTHKEDQIIVAIQDSGKISDDVAASLFKEGFSTKNENGTGMGLFYCKKLLHKMNAEIYLTNKSPSTFSIHFKKSASLP